MCSCPVLMLHTVQVVVFLERGEYFYLGDLGAPAMGIRIRREKHFILIFEYQDTETESEMGELTGWPFLNSASESSKRKKKRENAFCQLSLS